MNQKATIENRGITPLPSFFLECEKCGKVIAEPKEIVQMHACVKGWLLMVSKKQGKSMMKRVVQRYGFVEENPRLIKRRLLSEQDMTTKFVLPMLEALNWNPLKIATNGPEVHEKGFRERDIEGSAQEKARRGGLPDFSLHGRHSKVPFFVEVKHPKLKLNPKKHLKKYKDGHIVFLTSFKESQLVVIGEDGEKNIYSRFVANSPRLYVDKFDNLWKHISNSQEAERTRKAIKAWRPGQRKPKVT